jgi:hypothetical protein
MDRLRPDVADVPERRLMLAILIDAIRCLQGSNAQARADVAGWVRRVTTVADPDSLATRLIDDTGGNPLYVRMLLDRITDGGEITVHPELHKLVLSGLDGMSAEARDVLAAGPDVGALRGSAVRLNEQLVGSLQLSGPRSHA